MRLIGTLPAESSAKQFCDYLVTQRIACHVEEAADGGWQVWIEHDDAVEQGAAELANYQSNASDPKFAASREAEKVRREENEAALRRQRNYRDVRTTTFSAPTGSTPATLTLIFITLIVGALTNFGANYDSPFYKALLFQSPAAVDKMSIEDRNGDGVITDDEMTANTNAFDSVRHGQVWRLITPIFLHFGILHLVLNMMWLWRFGQSIERAKGSLKFIGIALAIAVISCTVQGAWQMYSEPPGRSVVFGGMSGVDAGLFGYAWMCGRMRPYEQLAVDDYSVGLMLGWLVLCSLGFVGLIANAAHWSGLAVGIALGVAPSLRKRASF